MKIASLHILYVAVLKENPNAVFIYLIGLRPLEVYFSLA